MSKKVRKVSRIDDPNIEAQIDEIIRVVNSLDARTEDADAKATVNTQPGMVFREFPSDPVFGNCEFVYDVTLRWYKAEGAVMYEIRTDLNWGNESGRVYLGSALQYSFTPGQRYYTFYIKSINPAGKYSQGYDEIILGKPVPSIPNLPETKPFFSAVKIIPAPNHEQGILGHYAYVTIEGETDKVDIPIGSSHVYNAPSGTEMTIEMSAYDILGEGGKSAPVTASTLKLSDRDIPEEIIEPSNLVKSLREDIDLTKTNAIDALAQISDLNGVVDSALAEIDNTKQRVSDAETDLLDAKNRLSGIEDEVDSAKNRLGNVETELENIDGIVTTHDQQITNLEGELSSKVSQNEFNSLVGTVTAQGTQITQNTTAITQKADKSTVDALTGRVSAAEATLSTHADEIAARATKEEVDAIEDRVTAAEGQLSVQADKIEAKAEKSEVQALEEDLSAVSTQVGTLTTSYDSISARVEAVEGVTDDLTGEVSDVKSRTGSLELRAGNIEASVSAIEEDIDEHGNRLLTVEDAVFNVLPGQIALKADASIVDEQGTRITTAEQNISALDGAITQAVTRINQSAISKPSGGKLWHFDTSLESTDGVKPLEGAVATLRPNEGRFGGAVAVEEGTTNLVLNPSFENDLTNWDGWGSPPTREVVTTQKLYGSKALHLITNGNNQGVFQSFTVSLGVPYTLSVWVKVITGLPVIMVGHDGTYPTAVAPAEWTGDGQWHRLTLTFTASTATNIRIYLGKSAAGATGEYYFDAVQLEAKPFATSFVDGTRAAGKLEYPQSIWNHATGTFAAWVKTPTDVTTDRVLTLQWAKNSFDAPTRFGIRMNTSGRFVVSYGSADTLTTADSYNDGEWHHVVLTWVDGTADIHLYVDGERVVSASEPISVSNPGGRYRGVIPIGHRGYTYNDQWWNGLIDELLILPYAATEDEIQQWYRTTAPFYDPAELGFVGSQVQQLADKWTVTIQKTVDDKNVATGFGLAIGEDDISEFAVLADRFRVFGSLDEEGEGTALFVVDAQTNKAYLNVEEVIAAGAIKAEHLEADSVLAYLVQAGFAQFDEANVLDLLEVGGRIRVGDNLEIGGNRIVVEGYEPVTQKVAITEDTCTWQEEPDTNFSSGISLDVVTKRFNGAAHTFLKIPIPSGATNILSAKLRLYCNTIDPATLMEKLEIRPVAENWNHTTITWDDEPDTIGDPLLYDPPASSSWATFDITPIAQKWLSGDIDNYGIRLAFVEPSADLENIYFRSSRHEEEHSRPYVEITYASPTTKVPRGVLGDLEGLYWMGQPLPPNTYSLYIEDAFVNGTVISVDERGNYSMLDGGRLAFYRATQWDESGNPIAHSKAMYPAQIVAGTANSGHVIDLYAQGYRFLSEPKIIVFPNFNRTYLANHQGQDVWINWKVESVDDSTPIFNPHTGAVKFKVRVETTVKGGNNIDAEVSLTRRHLSGNVSQYTTAQGETGSGATSLRVKCTSYLRLQRDYEDGFYFYEGWQKYEVYYRRKGTSQWKLLGEHSHWDYRFGSPSGTPPLVSESKTFEVPLSPAGTYEIRVVLTNWGYGDSYVYIDAFKYRSQDTISSVDESEMVNYLVIDGG